MAIAIDPKQVHRYVLKADRKLPKEKQTVFPIRAQTDRTEREASALLHKREFWESGMHVLRNCMDKPENFLRADGSEVEWTCDSDGKPSRATLCRITEKDRAELLEAIQAIGTSQLTETDLGN